MDLFDLDFVSWTEALIRVGLAILFGLILGWDRDSKNKPIDFRAYMIVCTTTCIVALLSLEMQADLRELEEFVRLDLGKIISGTLTGIGFLGAGAIIKRENDQVVGTATGASVWAAGGVGLALGYGAYGLAMIGFVAVAAILVIGGLFVPNFHGEEDKEHKK